MVSPKLALILNKLDRVKGGKNEWSARCPAHKDRRNSLSITENDSSIALFCHAGCSIEAITAALGLTVADLFLTPKGQPSPVKTHRPAPPPTQIVAEYSYTDEAGQELFQVVRLNPKNFRQRHQNSSREWAWNLEGVRRVLYRLPELAVAKSLYFVEGEKDVESLRALGLTATTSPGGAQAWRPEYASALAGKNITLIPDRDGPGLDYARDVARDLEGKAQLSVILLPPPAKDISDWLEAGSDVRALPGMAQDISALFAAQAESTGPEVIARGRVYRYIWTPEHVVITLDRIAEERHILTAEVEVSRGNVERQARLGRARINLLSTQGRGSIIKYLSIREPGLAHAWDRIVQLACDETVDRFRAGDEAVELWTPEEAMPRQDYLLWPLLPKGQPTLLFGEGDSGKSFFALFAYIIIQLPWADNPLELKALGWPINGLYCDWETTEQEVLGRLWRIKEGYNLGGLSVAYRACRRPLAGDVDGIQRMLIQHKADFLVIDSVAAASGGDINAPQPSEEFYGALRELRGYTSEHVTSLILGHTSKDQMSKRKSPFGCYSEDTEVLTKRGWLRHSELGLSDEIATYDGQYHCLRWEQPSAIHSYPYKGSMLHFNHTSTDCLVTPEHRMCICKGKKQIFMTAKDCPSTWHSPKAAPLKPKGRHLGQQKKTFQLSKGCPHLPLISWLRFLGFWLSEGGIHPNGMIQLHQTVGPVLEAMKDALRELGFPFTETIARQRIGRKEKHTLTLLNICGEKEHRMVKYQNKKWYCHSKRTLTKWLRVNCGQNLYEKHFPQFIWELPHHTLTYLLDSLIKGDGSWLNRANYRYYSASQRLADDVGRLSIILGYSALFYTRDRSGHIAYEVGINMAPKRTQVLHYGLPEEYSGTVWCLTVPSGAYVTRRNGKTSIQGNSVFFYNYARQVVEVRRAEGHGNSLKLTLLCRKANNSRRFDPLGFEFTFGERGVTVQPGDAQAIMTGGASTPDRIRQALSDHPLSFAELITALGDVKPDTLAKALTRLRQAGEIELEGQAWQIL